MAISPEQEKKIFARFPADIGLLEYRDCFCDVPFYKPYFRDEDLEYGFVKRGVLIKKKREDGEEYYSFFKFDDINLHEKPTPNHEESQHYTVQKVRPFFCTGRYKTVQVLYYSKAPDPVELTSFYFAPEDPDGFIELFKQTLDTWIKTPGKRTTEILSEKKG